METEIDKRLITVHEYYKMAEVGILKPTERVELIHGEILYMSPVGSKHASIVDRLADFLTDFLRKKCTIKIQAPIILDKNNEPEPDVTICKYRSDYYIEQLPVPEDIEVIIEVADSSYRNDKESKAFLYASQHIPIYWLISIEKLQIEVYSNPDGMQYKRREIFSKGEELPLIDGIVQVNDIFI